MKAYYSEFLLTDRWHDAELDMSGILHRGYDYLTDAERGLMEYWLSPQREATRRYKDTYGFHYETRGGCVHTVSIEEVK